MLVTYKRLKEEYSIDSLIFPSNIAEIQVLPEKTIYQWINELQGLEKQQIINIIRRPFSNDVLEDLAEEIDAYTLENEELEIEESYCVGLGLAYIQQTASISLNSHSFWCNNEIDIYKTDSETLAQTTVTIHNIADFDLISKTLKGFLESNKVVVLEETELNPDEKSVHLRDDHGKDILQAFAERILQSGFVISVINSLPNNRRTNRFIRRTFSDGKIEIVLHWEDAGYGMVIQSTGRNYHETIVIAKLLRERFDR